jgi:hypothetical protein
MTWKILDVIANGESILGVRYLLSISEGEFTVESEGEHFFKKGTVNIPYLDIKEYNLIDWVNSEIDENHPLKVNLQNQLNSLKNPKNNKLPWLANTFTPGS